MESLEAVRQLPLGLGGAAHYRLLYFLVRATCPAVVVETGVAAGFSTRAILSAIGANGRGHLYSSDFPYFRMNHPEKLIGYVVEDELKHNWELFLHGDSANLDLILPKAGLISLLHYDSDKSYGGRRLVMQKMSERLTPDAIIIMDDIQDNFFFRDYVLRTGIPFRVFEFQGKFVGVASRMLDRPAQAAHPLRRRAGRTR